MSFNETFDNLSNNINANLRRFIELLSSDDDEHLDNLVNESTKTTKQNFGNTMRLFAPLYLK